ncbi:hypothetical protein NEMBOFW57_001198 [Staphylotrichum longicolle]|uniref:Uncharacterized protein n=1 Tax=Staphylotrichum longicolle TaxID=669026 RepID=A0AAD4F173_9PEZI|nr:hypothetical protein NEMBOFW57_001198 [Staphylotrichum longicolle]
MRGLTHSLLRLLGLLMLAALAAAQSSSDATSAPPASSEPPASSNPPASSSPATRTATTRPTSTGGGGGGGTLPTGTSPPDVLLRVPELHVGKIELDVDNLRADLNLNAEIANLVTLNVGVQVGIEKVNITIADVDAQVDLVIRLGNIAKMVNRTLASLDLNPLLINLLNEVGDVVDSVVGAVDGLLGSIIRGDIKLNFLIDNLGNIVQEVVGSAGDVVSSIVGNFEKNMTFTGVTKQLGNGLTQKTYRYDALGSLVNIIFNTLGQVVQAVVVGKDNTGGGGSSTSAAPSATTSPTAIASSAT